ncbi:MAG: helicase-associated domain-containing protein [Chloroflexi bacterium]|nr:helicase-associated domain-containing protein [Chloroflexota bacterium]
MPKRIQPRETYEYLDDDDSYDEYGPLELTEEDIAELVDPIVAAAGLLLFETGTVSMCNVSESTLSAVVLDDGQIRRPRFELDADTFACDCPRSEKPRDRTPCVHVAALLYAWARAPHTFAGLGDYDGGAGSVLELLDMTPEQRKASGMASIEIEAMARLVRRAPPEVRNAFSRLNINAPASTLATIQTELNWTRADVDLARLAVMLDGLSVAQLRAVAARRGIPLQGNAKAPIIETLAAQLGAAAPPQLTPDEELLLQIENTLYGLTDAPADRDLLQAWKWRRSGDAGRARPATEGLQTAGYLFPCMLEDGQPHYHWSPVLHGEDVPLLPVHVKPVERTKGLRVVAPAMPVTAWIDAALDMTTQAPLHMRVQNVPAGRARPFAQGGWEIMPEEAGDPRPSFNFQGLTVPLRSRLTDESLDALGALTGESRFFAAWLGADMTGMGLAAARADSAVAVDPALRAHWQAKTIAEQIQTVWDGYLAGVGAFAELRMAFAGTPLVLRRSGLDPTFDMPALTAEIGLGREFIARLLRSCPAGEWLAFDSLADIVRAWRADFFRHSTEPSTWWFADAKSHRRLDATRQSDWQTAWRPALNAMLCGPLNWLGVVELGYAGDKLAAFRITPLGAWLVSRGRAGAPPATAPGDSVAWLDHQTFRVRGGAAAHALTQLRPLAEPAGAPLTFRVTAAALSRAVESGIGAAAIVQRFADMGAPLPADLRALAERLAANFGRLHLYEKLTVIELADDIALRELLAGTSLRRLIIHQFSPRLVAVRDDAVDEFMAELTRKGYTPLVKQAAQ